MQPGDLQALRDEMVRDLTRAERAIRESTAIHEYLPDLAENVRAFTEMSGAESNTATSLLLELLNLTLIVSEQAHIASQVATSQARCAYLALVQLAVMPS